MTLLRGIISRSCFASVRMSGQIPCNIIQQLENNASQADGLINSLRAQLRVLQKQAYERQYEAEIAKLEKENGMLEVEVEKLKTRLIQAEIKNGKKLVNLPISGLRAGDDDVGPSTRDVTAEDVKAAAVTPPAPSTAAGKQEKKKKKEKGNKEDSSKTSGASNAQGTADQRIDVSRLLLKVGRIVSCSKHPDADSLYVEEVDVGEEKCRTVVSGLVKHVPLDQMTDRIAVFMCNLKPAKMRGILSQGMIMCASCPDAIEILLPPDGSQPGDVVTAQGYAESAAAPDEQLNPKRKVWEQVAPDLVVSGDGVATYKGSPLEVAGKGVLRAPTLTNVNIK